MDMIKHNAKRKLIAAAVTALLIWTAVWPTISVKAEGQDTLKVAQYVKTETTKQSDGSYSGKWIADVPMAEVLKPVEPDMKKEHRDYLEIFHIHIRIVKKKVLPR